MLQVTSRTPGQTPVLDAWVGCGNHETFETNVHASRPWTDNIAADIAIATRDLNGGWGTAIATGEPMFTANDFAARSHWEFELSPDMQVKSSAAFPPLIS